MIYDPHFLIHRGSSFFASVSASTSTGAWYATIYASI